MSRKALLLFVATSVIWGSSFLFIRVAVEFQLPWGVIRLGMGTSAFSHRPAATSRG